MGSSNKSHGQRYGQGAKDSKATGFFGHIIHDLIDTGVSVIPHQETSESKSYEAGWHNNGFGSVKNRNHNKSANYTKSSGYYSSSGTSNGEKLQEIGEIAAFIITVFVGIAIIGGVIWFFVRLNIDQANSKNKTTGQSSSQIAGNPLEGKHN